MKIQVIRGMKPCTLAYVYTPVSTPNLIFILSPVIFYLSNILMECYHFAAKSILFDSLSKFDFLKPGYLILMLLSITLFNNVFH